MQHKINLALFGLLVFTLNQGCAQNADQQNTDQKSDSKEKGTAKKTASTNNLADATSPYLRQHADNPVNWYKWGDKAFEKAKTQNKLVIISIGYAACHWCHVMEHESFMDSSVAQYMNDHFVSIKVDREQRPDVDDIYMTAARLTSKSGGWPLNAIALPNGKPVVAGTYFPKDKWLRFLKRMQRVYNNDPKRLRQQAQKVTQGIQQQSFIEPAEESKAFNMKDLDRYFNDHLVTNIDWEIEYGNRKAQKGNKFPNASNFAFQLHYYHLSGNEKALDAVTTTLDHMLKGGIYDQIGGGFSRYSTDQMWKVPHFEKMLYDNAQLVSLYSKAYKVTGHERYKRVVTQTLDFIDRVMTSPEGGFYSSLNADSEGEEGKYYVWTEAQIDEVLNEQAELVKDYYNVKPDGNWEHDKNVLFRKKANQAFAQEKGMSVEQLRKIIDEAREQLFEERQPRTMPSKDDKVLTSWNALMLQGYLDAYEAFGKQAYLDKALKNARFLDKNLIQDDFSVKRVYKDGQANIDGFLDDYSYVINAFIQVYEVTMDKKWLEKAEKLADYTLDNFYDPSTGLFFYKSKHSEALIADQRDMTDNTKPSGNSSMANALLKLSKYYYEKHAGYADTAQQMLSTVSQKMDRAPAHFANWLTLMSYFAEPTFEVAIMGEQYQEKGKELRGHYLPHAFFMGSQQAENLPLLKNRYVEGQTTIYVCRNQVCQLPVTEVDKALQQIDEMLNDQKQNDDR